MFSFLHFLASDPRLDPSPTLRGSKENNLVAFFFFSLESINEKNETEGLVDFWLCGRAVRGVCLEDPESNPGLQSCFLMKEGHTLSVELVDF